MIPNGPFLPALALCALAPAIAVAQEPQERYAPGGTFSVTFENDVFGDTDRDYTNGIRFDYITPRNDLPLAGRVLKRGLEWLPGDDAAWYMTYAIGQNIYTPTDISLRTPPAGERPYAGFLYGSVGIAADSGSTLDVLALEFGMVGPSSLAEPTQKLVHEVLGVQDPKGWNNQLDDEFAFRFVYERKYKFTGDLLIEPIGLAIDFAPHYNVSLGTVDTSAGIGGTLRLGRDLTEDYGPPRIRPAVSSPGFFREGDGFNWYLFVGAEGRVVARNLFIEGNTWGGEKGVDPTRFVGDLQAGAAVQVDGVEVAYTHVIRSPEYEGQDGLSQFGSVNVRFKF